MSGSATNQNGPVGHTGSFNFRGSLAAATAGDRPQATAGDRRRPQATAGEEARAQQKNDPARLPLESKHHPALSRRLGTSRTSERRRWADASGDPAKAVQRSAGRMTRAMATSHFPLHGSLPGLGSISTKRKFCINSTPPGTTAPAQSNDAARRAGGAERASGLHDKPRASHRRALRIAPRERAATAEERRPSATPPSATAA